MVDTGALVTTNLVRGKDSAEKYEHILGTLPKSYAGNRSLEVDKGTCEPEVRHSKPRNRATGSCYQCAAGA